MVRRSRLKAGNTSSDKRSRLSKLYERKEKVGLAESIARFKDKRFNYDLYIPPVNQKYIGALNENLKMLKEVVPYADIELVGKERNNLHVRIHKLKLGDFPAVYGIACTSGFTS